MGNLKSITMKLLGRVKTTAGCSSWIMFVSRVKRNIWPIPKDYIDKTICSMSNRTRHVLTGKGHCTKY